MNQHDGRVLFHMPRSIPKWVGVVCLGILLIGWLIASSSAAQASPGRQSRIFQATATSTPAANLPVILKAYSTITPTPTQTSTRTTTYTATPTGTYYTPTPTRTGTITPAIGITPSVSPTEAHINTPFTFTFKVTNYGTAPATSVAFLLPLPAFLDITSVTISPTTKGSQTHDAHTTTVTIGTLNPNELVTITIVAKVNSGAQTQNVTSTATVTYDGTKSTTKSVTYRVVGTSLPNTGEMPIEPNQRAGPDPSLLFLSLTFGLAAIFTLWYGFWARTNKLPGVKWYFGIGVLLIAAALVSGLAGGGFLQSSPTSQPGPVAQAETPTLMDSATPEMLAGFEIAPAFAATDQPGRLSVYRHITAEPLSTLPYYPIPTPTFIATPASVTETVDTSPVVRLIIPAIEVDAEVKYVPWDNTLETWLINGLHQEIAWLGGSSWPGLGSNTVLAGHVTIRDYGNGPFRFLDQLAVGDVITVYTNANIYTYHVRQSAVVEEDALWVAAPTDNPQLTLITCTDWDRSFQLYMKRLIIFADLVKTDPIAASTGN